MAYHHVPQTAYKTCAIGLGESLSHRQLLETSYRTDSRSAGSDANIWGPLAPEYKWGYYT